jgi:serine/threonine-protein kinase RsbT
MENRAEQKVGEISVMSDEDVILARQRVRLQAQETGFSLLDQTKLVTAVSELARNIVVHAKEGKVSVFKARAGDKTGLKVVFEDKGPGIPDIEKAMEEGFSTVGSIGIGLKGAKRLVDEFDIKSFPGKGTIVTVTKWL